MIDGRLRFPLLLDDDQRDPAIARTAGRRGCQARHMRTGATFRVHGADPTRDVPALTWTKSSHGDLWSSSVEPAEGVELDAPLRALLAKLEASPEALVDLQRRGGTFDFFCYLGSRSTEHCSILGADLLGRIASIPAELWLDVYAED